MLLHFKYLTQPLQYRQKVLNVGQREVSENVDGEKDEVNHCQDTDSDAVVKKFSLRPFHHQNNENGNQAHVLEDRLPKWLDYLHLDDRSHLFLPYFVDAVDVKVLPPKALDRATANDQVIN